MPELRERLTSLFLPDLSLWYPWHSARGTLPAAWKGETLAGICRRLGLPCWQPVRAWSLATPGIEVRTEQGPAERTIRWLAPAGTLEARWTLGPDGDWWQAEYPVKNAGDLAAAAQIVEARAYSPQPADLSLARTQAAPGDLAVLELPMRPYQELLHSFLGFGDGFLLLFQEPERVAGLLAALEAGLQALVGKLSALDFEVALSPDNLDSQFVTPPAFVEHLRPSYRATADALHEAGKLLAVHAGGPVRGLLPGLAETGVDLIERICGPPQSDATLGEARGLCGDRLILWGGLPQDLLDPGTLEGDFRQAAEQATREARADRRALLGVADRVPVSAPIERLELLRRLAAQH
jgi:hypothetical protein